MQRSVIENAAIKIENAVINLGMQQQNTGIAAIYNWKRSNKYMEMQQPIIENAAINLWECSEKLSRMQP